uniref:Uncharacterized protein n=1 Tax=Rhizophagus irregularis (strain DAOM 181602 / DAOM 197198 / MUCL 43194) TaxID=747089 RepID=U9T9X3_RHIID
MNVAKDNCCYNWALFLYIQLFFAEKQYFSYQICPEGLYPSVFIPKNFISSGLAG